MRKLLGFFSHSWLLFSAGFCFLVGVLLFFKTVFGAVLLLSAAAISVYAFWHYNRLKLRWWWHGLPLGMFPKPKYRDSISAMKELKRRIRVFLQACKEERSQELLFKSVCGENPSDEEYACWERRIEMESQAWSLVKNRVGVEKQRLHGVYYLMRDVGIFSDRVPILRNLIDEVKAETEEESDEGGAK
jgi:hypothetical protein